MRPSGGRRLLAWALLLGALLAGGLWRLSMSYDLGLFLPAPRTMEQQVLVERLGESPGSRYVLVAVPDDPERVTRLVASLRGLPDVERVLSDLAPPAGQPPDPLWSHRFLLADMDWRAEGLESVFSARLAELGLGTDATYEAVVARDPALLSLDLLQALAPDTETPWVTGDGRRVLVAVTTAPAFRLEAQARAVNGIRQAVAGVFGTDSDAVLSGAGVFGVTLRDTIRHEATWRSTWASAAIVAVLLLVYRRPAVLVLAALPLAAGLICGLAMVSLVYGQVHGITLAFGFTLLGVAIDYPLHFLSRARVQGAAPALRATWPTLRLSALSTGLAYAALMAGGALGMAQLGLFSAAGVVGAAATTRYVLPWLVRGKDGPALAAPSPSPRLRPWAFMLLAGAGGLLAWQTQETPWWESDLAALSPVPAAQLAREGRLRQATGAPNIRYQVALRGENLQSVLADSTTLHDALDTAVAAGLIERFGDLTPLLPPDTVQERRRQAIPGRTTLEERLRSATNNLPFDATAFTGFVHDAVASHRLPALQPDTYAGTTLEGALGQYLYRNAAGQWTALATLGGDPDVQGLEQLLAVQAPDARLVDLRAASESLVTDYRQRTLAVLGGVLVLIALLLTWRVRPGRAAWTLSLVLASVFLAATVLRAWSGPLDLYHVTGLLLVAGIGLDYALFLGKADRQGAGHAVFACMASTVAAFSVLAGSAIPALHSLGSTVALGSALCFAAAWLGARPRSGAK